MSMVRHAWRRSTPVRVVAVAYLIAFAIGAGILALGALSNLWADYRDSETRTYLEIGLPALVACVAALVAAARIWRDR
jgi:hypothetical protein